MTPLDMIRTEERKFEEYLKVPEIINPPRFAVELKDSFDQFMDSLQDIVTTTDHKTLFDAILADIFDFIPILGDVANEERVADAMRRGDKVALKAQTIDLFLGVIPIIGDIADFITPTNTLLYLRKIGMIEWDPPLPPIPNIFKGGE